MKKMNLGETGKDIKSSSPFDRLYLVLDKAFTQMVNTGCPSAGLSDLTVAAVAVRLVRKEILKFDIDDPEVDRRISALEGVNFCVFGDTTRHMAREGETERNIAWVKEVVKPVFDAYMADEELRAQIPDAENIIRYLVEQWLPKDQQ